MEMLDEFTDDRLKGWCIHCGATSSSVATNWDHAPSKSLLDRPLPPHVPQVEICKRCNSSFSLDEEYFATFLSCVIAGSTSPEVQSSSKMKRALERNPSLRARLDAARSVSVNKLGIEEVVWLPEQDRINRVVVKNARGHAFFEFGEPMLDEPERVWAMPLAYLSEEQRGVFDNASTYGWPEVGSRMMSRLVSGADLDDGWVVVQDGVYRYAVLQEGTLLVRSVIRNYLATEVAWN